MPLEPGTLIGPYEIRGLLGAGGMGEVYLAWDPRLGREVALKRMIGPAASDSEGRARFMTEARAVAALKHPGIVAIHDILWEEGAPYLVMERLEGETLRERLKRGALPEAEARNLWIQAVRAVAEAHRQGVIHRDLKPENLFLTSSGAVKVLDFGLAKRLDAAETDATHALLTQEGVLLGTLAYLSPEQARGEPATRRSDVHALGLILLELLTGRPAFRKDTTAETLAAILAEDPLKGLALASWASPLLQGTLQKDPARRPADASALEDQPTLPMTWPEPRGGRRRSTGALLAGAAGVAVLGLGGLWLSRRAPAAPVHSASPSPAWAALQRAEYLREHRDWSRYAGVALAQDPVVLAYREALRLDPELLEAHLGLGEHLVGRVFFLKGGEGAAAPEAFEHIQRVLQARPDHPEALSLRGRLAFSVTSGFRVEQALEDLLRATRLDPASETARYHLGSMCEHAGLLPEAGRIYESSKVAKGGPGGGPAYRLARVRWMEMDLEASRRLYEAEPPDRQWELPGVLERLGRPAEALARLESLETLSEGGTTLSTGPDLLSIRAYLEARRGLTAEARRHAAASEAQGQGNAHFHHAAYHLACAYAALGDEAQALRLLRITADGGLPCYPLFLKDPRLDPLRASPSFKVFLESQRVRFEGFRKIYASG